MSQWARDAWSSIAPYAEPALTFATSMAADVPAGLAGLAGLAFEGDTPEEAAARIERIRDELTYLPRTERGIENLTGAADAIGTVMEKAGDVAEKVTGKREPFKAVADWVAQEYGPEAATAVFMAPQVAGNVLGLRAASAARAGRAAARAADALPEVAADVPRLAHAQTFRGTHFGNVAGLSELDPAAYGTGALGAEAKRLAPDLRERSYFYLDDRAKGERGTGPHRYQAELRDVYDLSADPLAIRQMMRERYTNPADARINPGMIDWEAVTNETERYLKSLGYGGFATPQGTLPAAVMWGRTPVMPAPLGG